MSGAGTGARSIGNCEAVLSKEKGPVLKARLAYCNANSIQSGPAQLTPRSSSFLKATEPARLLPLLVPALSEAKGWHQQQELGT